jgi:nucleotide-binding universal stress UspA family protein
MQIPHSIIGHAPAAVARLHAETAGGAMTPIHRILVPADFSGNSLIATGQAGALARQCDAQVTLLYGDEFQVMSPFTTEAHRAAHVAARGQELMEFGKEELRDVAVKRVVCCGDPAKVIVARAQEEQSDLIVMPARGSGVFRRFLLGSVTAKVLHDADCPVWTGAHLAEPHPGHTEVRNVLCAVDFGAQTNKAIHWAAEVARAFGAKLTLVHAVLEMPPNLPDRFAFQWHEESNSGASDRLHEMLVDCDVTAKALVVSDGDVPKALAAAVRRTGADLLVIGRNAVEGGAGRPGSQTYPIVCGSPCAVVSV